MPSEIQTQILLDLPMKDKDHTSFGFPRYSDLLTDLIVNSYPQFTIGIFGPWGSGKTTLMRLVYGELSNRFISGENVVPVWFPAWRYEREKNLSTPLLYTIRDEISDHTHHRRVAQRTQRTAAVEAFRKLGDFLGNLAEVTAAATSFSISTPGETFKVEYDMGKALNAAKALAEQSQSQSEYYDYFKHLDRFVWRQGEGDRVVVFVDDLDRCFAPKAVQVLEIIKLFFDLPGFIFVLGVDYNVIAKTVDSKYGPRNGISGAEYIKKMVQVPLHLPPIRSTDVEKYVLSIQFDKLGITLPSEMLQRIVKVVASGVQANPREVKRFINNFIVTKRMSGDDTDPEKLISLLVIQFQWRELYKRISQHPTAFKNLGRQINAVLEENPELIKQVPIAKLREKAHVDQVSLVEVANLLRDFEEDNAVLNQEAWEFLLDDPGRAVLAIDNLGDYLFFADATEFIAPRTIRFKNTARHVGEYTGQPKFEWRIWVDEREQILSQIESVVYHLPSGNFRADLPQNGFEYISSGWREIAIDIDVFFKNGARLSAFHKLELLSYAQTGEQFLAIGLSREVGEQHE